jgi:acyl-coenzyme A synthetase/AMP-(fatty) acid ligase
MNAESIVNYLNLSFEDRPITSLPMHYSYGLSVINSHLISGATILLTDKSIAQKEFWNFARVQKASSMAGVPYTYEMLKRLRFFRMSLPDMKVLTQAGGKLSSNLVQEYAENASITGKKFIVMYGQTEATARMSYLPFEYALEKSGSIGIAIPGGSFRLVDNDGTEITESNKDGELVYLGKNVCVGYADCKEDLIKGDENNGKLYTGDIARRDKDGYYYITGRKKRFIKIYGNRVNLDAAEQIIKEITTSCACVGVDDKMLIYITDTTKSEQCRNFISEKTGLNSKAFEVRVIDEIPKNTSGKVLYANLLNE